MRRKDREIHEKKEIIKIIEKCKYCRIGLSDNDYPYIVPLNYGYSYENDKLTLFFHSAKEGKKINILKNNNKACFEIDCDTKLIEGENACKYAYEYRSIIGFGKIILMETDEEKTKGLNYLMRHQTGQNKNYAFGREELEKIIVLKMEVDEFKGKEKK